MHDNQRQAILLSYLAGVLDSEGTIRIQKCTSYHVMKMLKRKSPVYAAQITLGMTTKEVPELFQHTFGGSLREECVPGKRSIWRWAVTSRKTVTKIAKLLLPYLIVKRKHAEEIIRFCDGYMRVSLNQYGTYLQMNRRIQELQRREDAYLLFRKLNAFGAAATTEREDPEKGSDSLNSWETMRGELKCSPAT